MSEEMNIIIRTLDCDICGRFDAITMPRNEMVSRTKTTNMGIGAFPVVHNDHTRIIYFDIDGNFLGDTIALEKTEIPEWVEPILKIDPMKVFDEILMFIAECRSRAVQKVGEICAICTDEGEQEQEDGSGEIDHFKEYGL